MAAPKTSTPKDAQVMAAILKDMGIIDYEPRVINQMLEFTYRYITNILDDARVFSNHAKKKNLDIDDIKLSIQMQMDKSFTTPPPRDILIEIAKQRNNIPLPLIKPHCGPRLPPDRYCMTSCNYKLKSAKKPPTRQFQIGVPFGSINSPKINVQQMVTSVPKLNQSVNLPSKGTLSLVTKGASTPAVSIVTRPAQTLSTNSVPATPIIKISSGSSIGSSSFVTGSSSLTSGLTSSLTGPSGLTPLIVTQTIPASPMEHLSGKRKRDEIDDFDIE